MYRLGAIIYIAGVLILLCRKICIVRHLILRQKSIVYTSRICLFLGVDLKICRISALRMSGCASGPRIQVFGDFAYDFNMLVAVRC